MKTRPVVPTCQDTEKPVQKPLQHFTDSFAGEEYVTPPYFRPMLQPFNTSLLAPRDGDSKLCKSGIVEVASATQHTQYKH